MLQDQDTQGDGSRQLANAPQGGDADNSDVSAPSRRVRATGRLELRMDQGRPGAVGRSARTCTVVARGAGASRLRPPDRLAGAGSQLPAVAALRPHQHAAQIALQAPAQQGAERAQLRATASCR